MWKGQRNGFSPRATKKNPALANTLILALKDSGWTSTKFYSNTFAWFIC